MKKDIVTVIYDRKKTSARRGTGKVEVRIYLSRTERKYITIAEATPEEWKRYVREDKFADIRKRYVDILLAMEILGKDMTIASFNECAGIEQAVPQKKEKKAINRSLNMNFLSYLESTIEAEDIRIGTRKHKECVIEALRRFGKIKKLADLTPANIMAFDRWLRDGTRTDVTIYGYHKNVKCYTRQLRMADMIPYDPYNKVKIKRGKCKERQPLYEKELKKMCDAQLDDKMDRVRDLFIFAAYTGLAFCDTQLFNFKKMTEKVGKMYYIKGERLKTGSTFFTPILPPAMKVLEKYNFQLPRISKNVPFRFLSPWVKFVSDEQMMSDSLSPQTGCPYVISTDNITIHNNWDDYLRENRTQLCSFISQSLSSYLEKSNTEQVLDIISSVIK